MQDFPGGVRGTQTMLILDVHNPAYQDVEVLLRTSFHKLMEDGVITFNRSLVALPTTATTNQVLRKMRSENVRSIVVLPKDNHPKSLLEDLVHHFKICDMRDVTMQIGKCFDTDAGARQTDLLDGVMELKLGDVANCSGLNTYVPVCSKQSLASILRCFEKCSRTIIFSEENEAWSPLVLFSISDFLYIVQHHPFFGFRDPVKDPRKKSIIHSLLSMTFDDELLLRDHQKHSVIFADMNESLKSAIKKMVENKLTGIPIVNTAEHEFVVTVLSSTDMLTLMLEREEFGETLPRLLSGTALHFVSLIRQRFCLKAMYPVISERVNSNLFQVLQRMLVCRIHRVILVDEHNRMVKIVSISDLGRIIAREMKAVLHE